MDVYVNSPDRSEVATGFATRNTSSRALKSSYNFSASMGSFAGVVGSLATGKGGSGGEVLGRYASFFGF
jgi:hypothetical protein